MGGLFSTPTAPVQDNSAQLMMVEQQTRQNDLLYAQAKDTAEQQRQADDAAAQQLQEIEIRDAKAQAETDEREKRAAKGKKDLLYRNALGVEDEEDQLGDGMLKLGGNV